jgi:hypothetical protein
MTSDPLSAEHRQMLESGSAISPEVIAARGYRTVTNKRELAELGFSPTQRRVPGLLLPVHATDGSEPTHQYRPDSPRTGRDGKVVKYETPKNGGIRIDCPPIVRSQFRDPSVCRGLPRASRRAHSPWEARDCAPWPCWASGASRARTYSAGLPYWATWTMWPVTGEKSSSFSILM